MKTFRVIQNVLIAVGIITTVMMFFDDLESKLASDQTICKSILRDVKCPVHKLKARIIYDYDNDFTYAHITKCCCPQFAQIVADTIHKTETIDVVEIDDCEYTR